MVKATQSLYVVGEVINAEKEYVERDEGKNKTQYDFFIKLPNGAAINVRNNIWDLDEDVEKHEYVVEKEEELDEVVRRFKDKVPTIVRVSGRPNKEDKCYTWLTSYVNKKDEIKYQLEGFVDILDTTITDENKIIHYKNSDVVFENQNCSIDVKMYIEDTVDDKIELTDGDEEYPNKLTVTLPVTPENSPKIGQGYRFGLEYKKVKVEQEKEENESIKLDFEEEAKEANNFPVEKLVIKNVGKVDDMKLDSMAEDELDIGF